MAFFNRGHEISAVSSPRIASSFLPYHYPSYYTELFCWSASPNPWSFLVYFLRLVDYTSHVTWCKTQAWTASTLAPVPTQSTAARCVVTPSPTPAHTHFKTSALCPHRRIFIRVPRSVVLRGHNHYNINILGGTTQVVYLVVGKPSCALRCATVQAIAKE